MSADTTRRAFMGCVGLASVALIAPAFAVGQVVGGISPQMAALFEAEQAAKAAQEQHEHAVLDHPDFEAKDLSVRKALGQENDILCEHWCNAQHAIAGFPVECAADLQAKLRFMIANQMGDGMDWLPEFLVDATRLVAIANLSKESL